MVRLRGGRDRRRQAGRRFARTLAWLDHSVWWALFLFLLAGGCIALIYLSNWFARAPAIGLALIPAWTLLAVFGLRVVAHCRRPWLWLLAIVIIVRLLALISLDGFLPTQGDPPNYLALARAVLDGEGLVIDEPIYGPGLRSMFPPLYPLVLAGIAALFDLNVGTVWLLNLLIDLGSAVTLRALVPQCGTSRRAGDTAAWLFLIWPPFIFGAPVANKEGLTILAGLLVLLAAQRIAASPRTVVSAVWFGVTWGLLALTQPGLASFPALLLLFLLLCNPSRDVLRAFLTSTTSLTLIMLPWWIRNWTIHGVFIPLTTSAPLSLRVRIDGDYLSPADHLMHLPEVARFREHGAGSLQWVSDHPGWYLLDTMRRAVRAFAMDWATVERLPASAKALGIDVLLVPLLQAAHAALLLGACAALLRLGTRCRDATWCAVLLLLQFAVFGIWLEFGERHRYLLTPVLLLLVGGLVVSFGQRGRQDLQTGVPLLD